MDAAIEAIGHAGFPIPGLEPESGPACAFRARKCPGCDRVSFSLVASGVQACRDHPLCAANSPDGTDCEIRYDGESAGNEDNLSAQILLGSR